MNSRERVRAAVNFQQPDRVPMDLWGSDSRLNTNFYLRVVEELNLGSLGERIRPGSTSEYEDYRLSDMVQSDFRHINIGKPDGFKSYTDEQGNIIDEWGVGRKMIGKHPSFTLHPLADATIEDLENYKWPNMSDPGRFRGLAEKAKDWYENTDFAITATTATSGTIFELCQYLRGIEQFLMDLYVEPEFAQALIEKVTDLLIELNVNYVNAVGDYIEWIEFASDWGTQTAPFISPDCYEEFFLEPHKRLFAAVKAAKPNVKIFLHSCGSVRKLIPLFLESGVEILSALQPLAEGMDSYELKKEFGDKLVFHGGVDLQRAMIGTTEELEIECKKRLDAFCPGGGYIYSPSNHFQNDVPVQNFLDMYRFGLKYGKYE
ncbi:MAG: uroporphyrinogen decarboxylase [Oscillospiraceae bacterium]|nr:uroporphyrinogen decarboxylase [Oscillospiraceae bacterium]